MLQPENQSRPGVELTEKEVRRRDALMKKHWVSDRSPLRWPSQVSIASQYRVRLAEFSKQESAFCASCCSADRKRPVNFAPAQPSVAVADSEKSETTIKALMHGRTGRSSPRWRALGVARVPLCASVFRRADAAAGGDEELEARSRRRDGKSRRAPHARRAVSELREQLGLPQGELPLVTRSRGDAASCRCRRVVANPALVSHLSKSSRSPGRSHWRRPVVCTQLAWPPSVHPPAARVIEQIHVAAFTPSKRSGRDRPPGDAPLPLADLA